MKTLFLILALLPAVALAQLDDPAWLATATKPAAGATSYGAPSVAWATNLHATSVAYHSKTVNIPSGENPAAIVFVSWWRAGASQITNLTIGSSQIFTNAITIGDYGDANGKQAVYALTNPPTGNQTISVAWNGGGINYGLVCVLVTNANLDDLSGTGATSYRTGASITNTVNTSADWLVLDSTSGFASVGFPPTAGDGQTSIQDAFNSANTEGIFGTSGKTATGGTTTMTWTHSSASYAIGQLVQPLKKR